MATISQPVLDVRLGEPYDCAPGTGLQARYCVIWVDGHRFEGTLYETEDL